MRSNYHNIRAIISNVHNYSEMIYGATEYAKSLFRANVIKIKNTIETKLNIRVRGDDKNVIKIYSSPVQPNLRVNGKIEENKLFVKNSFLNNIITSIKPSKSVITILNSAYIYISKIFNGENNIYIENSFDHTISEIARVDENEVVIENADLEIRNNSGLQPKNNLVSIMNPSVNAAAWQFIRLEAMAGGLNAYYNQTISDTGRKKIV